MQKLALVGRTFFAVALIGLGIEHFIYRQFVTGRAAPWPQGVPGEMSWAFISGAFIVLAGAMFLQGGGVGSPRSRLRRSYLHGRCSGTFP